MDKADTPILNAEGPWELRIGKSLVLRHDRTYRFLIPYRTIRLTWGWGAALGKSYDANGNLTAQVPDGEWGQYGTLAQEVNFTNQDGIDVGDRAIGQYRGVRNQVTSGSRQLKWDWENRLIAVRQGSMLAHYDYDEGGERRLKTIGNAEVYYADRLFEEDKTNPVQTLNRVQIYLGDTRLVTKISPKDSGTGAEQDDIYTYHPDHLGSTSLVTNINGQVFEKVAYTPHGELFVNDSADSLDKVSLLFTGKERDGETGWYYFGARYLDPRTGIWLSSDPALGEYIPGLDKEANKNLPGMGGVFNPVNMAVYHFAGNNLVKYKDPDGKSTWTSYDSPGDVAPTYHSDFSDITDFAFSPFYGAGSLLAGLLNAANKGDNALKSAGLDLRALGGHQAEVAQLFKSLITAGPYFRALAAGFQGLFKTGGSGGSSLARSLSGLPADKVATKMRSMGYDVTVQASTKSRSGAVVIKVNNPGGERTITQVQVSPGGGRHGPNPYLKVSTSDQGTIKIIQGSSTTYKSDGSETATLIFTEDL